MNAPAFPIPARRSERWQDEIPTKLGTALEATALEETEAFASLQELAQQVEIDGYSLDMDSAVIKGEEWTVPGTIFVVLTYEAGSNDPVELNDAYPMEVRFHLEGGEVRIDAVKADTSSFYQ